jgi:hypothetical protein
MMRDLDRMIDEALGDEERAILRSIGEEPGFFRQVFGVFRGPTGWVNGVMMAAQALLFVAGAYAAWRFFGAADPVAQLRWGLPAAVLLILSAMLKLAVLPRMETNIVLRELKRLELQLALRRE